MASRSSQSTGGQVQFGVHALVWVGDTSDESISKAVTATATTGYDILELSLHNLENLDVERTARELKEADLGVVCSRGLAFDADISSDDPKVVERGARLVGESLDVTAHLGGSLLTGALYSAFGKAPHPVTAVGRRNAVAVLRELSVEAGLLGVDSGIEVCNRYETNVVNTAREGLRLMDDIGAENVVLHLDSYHMNIEEDDFVRPILEAGERLGYVHIGENHRGYLGSGHINFGEMFHALADIGYTGPITFESFSTRVAAEGLSNDLAVWRNLWDEGAPLAAHALSFMKGMVEASAPLSGE